MYPSAISLAPVVKVVQVPLEATDAFLLFTRDMGRWWPINTHSIAADTYQGRVAVTDLVFEERLGGRIYETMSDGAEGDWGTVQEWAPYTRVAFTWNPTTEERPDTLITVTFVPAGKGTEVTLVHTGWERLGEIARSRRDGYDEGWVGVLAQYVDAAS
jgi:uncharacterized protein YndB with AHSA1/START domain